MLGLTATPFRSDNRDIFSLYNDHVIYEIHIKDPINRDLLVPFQYYGILDEIDYSIIDDTGGNYNIKELERELSTKGWADLLVFPMPSIWLSIFRDKGVEVACVHSGTPCQLTMDRQKALDSLTEGNLKVIFAVDIPALDTVLFLGPTESFIVFLQQLGRGLRKYKGKEYLRVLDFIGNYKKAHYIPSLLAWENPIAKRRILWHQQLGYPEGCQVHFEFK